MDPTGSCTIAAWIQASLALLFQGRRLQYQLTYEAYRFTDIAEHLGVLRATIRRRFQRAEQAHV